MPSNNALSRIILRQIAQTGPLTLKDYMQTALLHPKHGYYTGKTVFGTAGDFTTAPEISQMFGEMVAASLIDRWQAMGMPSPVMLIECGPGRGTLMADILRTADRVPGFKAARQVHLVEASRRLRTLQAKPVPEAHFHDTLAEVPVGPTLLVANEFLDALPVHQFVYTGGKWMERMIGQQGGKLAYGLGAASSALALAQLPDTPAEDGDIIEVCPAMIETIRTIAKRLKVAPGAALLIDYGYSQAAYGDSFQAVKDHTYIDALETPGEADLTAHVNFAQAQAEAKRQGLRASAIAQQGAWLMALGIGHRAMMLADGKSGEARAAILDDLKRLTAADQMGDLFKVLMLSSPALAAPPPGFSI